SESLEFLREQFKKPVNRAVPQIKCQIQLLDDCRQSAGSALPFSASTAFRPLCGRIKIQTIGSRDCSPVADYFLPCCQLFEKFTAGALVAHDKHHLAIVPVVADDEPRSPHKMPVIALIVVGFVEDINSIFQHISFPETTGQMSSKK